MINYGNGVAKTNKAIKEMNEKGKHLMGSREMQVVKTAPPKSSSPKKKRK